MISVPIQQPETYIALYDYKPRMDDEIEIKAGHVVTVWENCDDWFRGVASGRYGLFPQNYVQKVEDSGGAGTHASGGACTNEMASKILYARRGSQILTTEREQESHSDPVFLAQSGQDMIPIPQQQPEKYKAVCDYKPIRHGEIEIKAGHDVTVWGKSDDWFRGEASGRYGYFPGNLVQKLEDNDSFGECTNELAKKSYARRAKLKDS
ncbi:SH3 domain-containing kinase-binding protein 1-like [Ruditapes philippinarum]|uniref:SH3 domain-containing kinase-binding protein 1-like n=1 Tax=Ruditapes philippinarum TaxID=129788 RepID=UPI00295C2C40|nr:SH3 domain-containing kinase-binding protein 1-like [Ruditapes philippinarum]